MLSVNSIEQKYVFAIANVKFIPNQYASKWKGDVGRSKRKKKTEANQKS